MDNRETRTPPSTDPAPTKIGIFRRVAVARYMRPLESDLPEMLAPPPPVFAGIGLVFLALAGCLLLL
jgi:hypothetical protein